MDTSSDRELDAPASSRKRVIRPGRARGIGSGWVVSAVLHGALLLAATRLVRHVEAVDVDEPEFVTTLDLRTTNFAPRPLERVREAAQGTRGEIPRDMPSPLLEPEEPAYDTNTALADSTGEFTTIAGITGSNGSRSTNAGSTVSVTRLPHPVSGPSSNAGDAAGAEGGAPWGPDGPGAASVYEPPQIHESPAILYPARARRASLEGQVKCRLHVAATGRVESVEIAVSSGHSSLDEAARSGLLTWIFKPATRDGVACACVVDHIVTFQLTRASTSER